MDNNKLRELYNPEGSELRRQQYRMLDMLSVLDKICKKYNLPYWLEGGTLLGAFRHGGFIPWDDDLDVQMLRSDYKKLMKVIKQELPTDIVLQTYQTDKGFNRQMARLRDLNSHLVIANPYDHYEYDYQGIFIDIFPMENIGIQKLSLFSCFLVRKIILPLNKKIPTDSYGFKKKMFRFIFYVECLIYSIFRLIDFGSKRNTLSYTYGTEYGFKCKYDDIFPLSEVTFENRIFPAPRHTEQILKMYYGENYMEIPSKEKRNVHSVKVIFYSSK